MSTACSTQDTLESSLFVIGGEKIPRHSSQKIAVPSLRTTRSALQSHVSHDRLEKFVQTCIVLRLRSALTCWANNSFVPRRQFLSLFRGAPACVSQNSSRQRPQSGSPTRRTPSLVLLFCFTSFAFALQAPEPPYISRCQASSLKTVVRFSSPTPARALYHTTSRRLWRNWSLNISSNREHLPQRLTERGLQRQLSWLPADDASPKGRSELESRPGPPTSNKSCLAFHYKDEVPATFSSCRGVDTVMAEFEWNSRRDAAVRPISFLA